MPDEVIKISQMPETTLGTGGFFVIARSGSNYKISEAILVNFINGTTVNFQAVDDRFNIVESRTTTNEEDITDILAELSTLSTTNDNTYLKLSGGTLTGRIKCAISPSEDADLVNKQYVDFLIANGNIIESTTDVPEGNNLYFTYDRVMGIFNTLTTDDIPEGNVNKYFNATNIGAIIQGYLADYLPLAGGELTGKLSIRKSRDGNFFEIIDENSNVLIAFNQNGQIESYGTPNESPYAAGAFNAYKNGHIRMRMNSINGNYQIELYDSSDADTDPKTILNSNGESLFKGGDIRLGTGLVFNSVTLSETLLDGKIERDDLTGELYFTNEDVRTRLGYQDLSGLVPRTQNELTKEPTGFSRNDSLIITANGDRTITLSGMVSASYRGDAVTEIVNGWVSPLHGTDTTKLYYLYYNGTTISWSETIFSFDLLQICIAKYDNTNARWYYFREAHGFMSWQDHFEFHNNIGTYKSSGGLIPTNSYVLRSTVSSERRIDVNETLIYDEDLPSVIPALTSKSYTQFALTGAGIDNIGLAKTDIINLSTNNPYYNQFTTSWVNTLVPANSVFTVWDYVLPMTADAISQAYRHLFVQPQWITQASNPSAGAIATAVTAEKNRLPSELNLNGLISTEIVAINRITLSYHSGNWRIESVDVLSGNKYSQIGSPSGNYLTSSHLPFISSGHTGTPLKIFGSGASGEAIEIDSLMHYATQDNFKTYQKDIFYSTGLITTNNNVVTISGGNFSKSMENNAKIEFSSGEERKIIEYVDSTHIIIDRPISAELVNAIFNIYLEDIPDYNYQLARGGHIWGQEYLSHLHKKIISDPLNNCKYLFSGDSTTAGDSAGGFNPSYLVSQFVGNNAMNGTFINAGHSGMDTYSYDTGGYVESDIAQAPDMFVLRWGINDPYFNRSTVQFEANLRSILTKIRASLSQSNCSIVLMTPNSTYDIPNGRYSAWYEKIVPIIRQCAIDFQCAFFDTYNLFNDSINAGDYMDDPYGDGRHIHPNQVMNYWIMSKFIDFVFPSILIPNKMVNTSSYITTKSNADIPTSYPIGLSIYRTGGGFPTDGCVVTNRHIDGVYHQKCYSYFDINTKIYERVGKSSGTDWTPWIQIANTTDCILKDAMSLTPKALLATPVADRLEYDGKKLFFTDATPTRRALATEDNFVIYQPTPFYSTGTVSVSGTTVTIVGGTFSDLMANNSKIRFQNGEERQITAYTDSTHVTIDRTTGGTVSGATFAIYLKRLFDNGTKLQTIDNEGNVIELYRSINSITAVSSGATYTLLNNRINVLVGSKLLLGNHIFTLEAPTVGIANEIECEFEIGATLATIAFSQTLSGTIPTWEINAKYQFVIIQQKDYNGDWRYTFKGGKV